MLIPYSLLFPPFKTPPESIAAQNRVRAWLREESRAMIRRGWHDHPLVIRLRRGQLAPYPIGGGA